MASACTNDSATTSGTVAIKASSVSTTGKTSLTSPSGVTSTVVITDFKINIGNIKFEVDEQDEMHDTDPSYEDVKLNGPFLLDLLNPNTTLSQTIASVNIPNAKYKEIKFNFVPSILPGEMSGNSYMIVGTINGIPFKVWSTKKVELEMDFSDSTKDFTVNNNDVSLNIKFQLDAFMAKLTYLANQGLLIDTDQDGVIEISTESDGNHQDIGELIKKLLENETHLDDRD